MSDQEMSNELAMPWERGGTREDAVERLSSLLAPEEGTTEEAGEPVAEEAADTADDAEAEAESEPDSDDGTTEAPTEEAEEEDADADEEEAEEEEPEEEAEPEMYTVKVDGEEVQVDRDELLSGYTRQATFTRRMQQLAEERRAAEAEHAQTLELRQQYQERIDLFEQAIQAHQPPEPDWDTLRREDPAEFAAQLTEHQARQQQLTMARAERDRLQAEARAEAEREMARRLATERQRLSEVIPDFADPAKASTLRDSMVNYAKSTLGFSDDDLSGVYDHRVLVMLQKAMRWDELQTQTKPEALKAKTKVKRKSPTLKPGGAKSPATKQNKAIAQHKEKLARTGRIDDAAAALFEILED